MPKFQYCPWCGSGLNPQQRDGLERMVCDSQACAFVYWGNPTPVVAAIVEHGEDVLLVRNVGWPEKWFGLVTGFLEREETPEAGVLRELREELGLEGEVAGFVGHYPFPQRNELIIAFHVRANGAVHIGPELAEYRRVPLHKLRPWPFATGDAVRDWLASRRDQG